VEETVRIALRKASAEDFDYCASLYFAAMKTTIKELMLSEPAQAANLRQRWNAVEVRMIVVDGKTVGWLQSRHEDGALFLGQLFIDAPFQRQGIGSKVLHDIIQEAAAANQAVTLGVVKINPARRLYERLGFRATHEDERKVYMRREPTSQTQI
jgi:ribosomal protein S18 acetylase RimI-like enzyme